MPDLPGQREPRSDVGATGKTNAATLLSSVAALAAPSTEATEAQARYRQDMAACNSGQTQQAPATCRREAGNALAEARRGHLNDAPGQYQHNALLRCKLRQGVTITPVK